MVLTPEFHSISREQHELRAGDPRHGMGKGGQGWGRTVVSVIPGSWNSNQRQQYGGALLRCPSESPRSSKHHDLQAGATSLKSPCLEVEAHSNTS